MFEIQFKEIPNKSSTNREKSITHLIIIIINNIIIVIQLKMAQHAMNG